MYTTDKRVVDILTGVLKGHGVKNVVCSPGSRNIPLLLGFKDCADIQTHMVVDERSAAFVALGMAQTSGRPVAIACTSGTALLNYAPAVAEARYQGIPLIVISADRPEEWIDQDDSQTIRQPGALENIVKKSYDISDRDAARDGDGRWYANRIFNDALLTAMEKKRGPVHINIRFSPPLNGVVTDADADDSRGSEQRIVRAIYPEPRLDTAEMAALTDKAVHSRILLVCGFMTPDAKVNKAVNQLRRHGNVVVMAETISNLHLPEEDYAIDTMLCCEKPEYPDLVISIGGALVSRMLKEYLRNIPADCRPEHWSVGYNDTTIDCFQSLKLRIETDPGNFLSRLSGAMASYRRHFKAEESELSCVSDYASVTNAVRKACIKRMNALADSAGWCEASAISLITKRIPGSDNLHVSNGTPIRYVQIMSRSIPHAEFCNRGVSGIEGSTSTAVGGALVANRADTWLLTGDMSLMHDLGGLYAAQSLDANIKILVVNNQGGGIFRFIKSSRHLEIREEMLCVSNSGNYSVKDVAEAFGFDYYPVSDLKELKRAMTEIKEKRGSSMIEIAVDGRESAKILCKMLNSDS